MRFRRLAMTVVAWCVASTGAGCALGPRSVEKNRLRYNEAVKTTTEEQLLLNIVRLRYTDSPSSLGVSSIAEQQEVVAGLKAIPFFTAIASGRALGGSTWSVLPQAELGGANRPTMSYTPLDDQEFTRRLFTPLTLEGAAYLSRTTWPISTVCRLYLGNLNWVSNAETASGPTPKDPPEYAQFLSGIEALQRLHDRKAVALVNEERDEKLSVGFPSDKLDGRSAVEAAKDGLEFRKDEGGTWSVVKKKSQLALRVSRAVKDDPDFMEFCRAFLLDPDRTKFDLTTDTVDPYVKEEANPKLKVLNIETRSLLQVLFFVAHGVEVPPQHAACGMAPLTVGPDGEVFDWQQVLSGLFQVRWSEGKKPPPCAHVAVRYKGCWFYIEESDRDTKATFALLVALSHLELGTRGGAEAPILTIPIGGP